MKRGFTLAEVMVAMVIMAVGLLALISVQIYSTRAAVSGDLRQQAVVCADSVTQQVVAALANPAPGRPGQLAGLSGRRADPEHQGETYSVDLVPGSSVPGPVQRSISVEVYCSDSWGPHAYAVHTEYFDQTSF